MICTAPLQIQPCGSCTSATSRWSISTGIGRIRSFAVSLRTPRHFWTGNSMFERSVDHRFALRLTNISVCSSALSCSFRYVDVVCSPAIEGGLIPVECWLTMARVLERQVFLTAFVCGDRDPLRFSIDVYDRQCPKRYQINSGHELGKERRQEFPVPTEQVDQQGPDTEIQNVISRRYSTFYECRENDDLECVRNDRQYHGGLKARTRRDRDELLSHGRADFRSPTL